MVLSSQVPRVGSGRQYMVSSRRRGPKWLRPLIILVVVLLVGYFIYQWLSGPDISSNADPSAVSDNTESITSTGTPHATLTTPTISPPQSAPVSKPTPTPSPAPQPKRSPILTIDPPAPVSPAKPEPTRNTNTTDTLTSVGTIMPPAAPQPVPSAPSPSITTDQQVTEQAQRGLNMIADGQLIEGRTLLSRILIEASDRMSADDAQIIRATLTSVSEYTLMNPRMVPGDTLVTSYTVKSGDRLGSIARQCKVPYQFLEKINHTTARRIQVGQTLKLVRGPFHVVIDKSDFRMDMFLRDPGLPEDQQWVYVKSFAIGLGSDDSTPVGAWIVKPRSKVENPSWANPRTSESFSRDDPKNPIGEYWLGLLGVDENTSKAQSYGIHGTIEPESIGRQMSMGCIRMRDDDVRDVYHMLVETDSTVVIQP